ncbi:hypothetical protein CspHIS471_0302860 [Cutaneotrichosporon sp. HIS471]|nr:hypothetical protein CspHIS471_0302860 [Cutaneotrichosporon sp. HIS471]
MLYSQVALAAGAALLAAQDANAFFLWWPFSQPIISPYAFTGCIKRTSTWTSIFTSSAPDAGSCVANCARLGDMAYWSRTSRVCKCGSTPNALGFFDFSFQPYVTGNEGECGSNYESYMITEFGFLGCANTVDTHNAVTIGSSSRMSSAFEACRPSDQVMVFKYVHSANLPSKYCTSIYYCTTIHIAASATIPIPSPFVRGALDCASVTFGMYFGLSERSGRVLEPEPELELGLTSSSANFSTLVGSKESAPRLPYATHAAIVHKIAQFACTPTKIAFRATCRSLRLLLDTEIFKRAILADERLRSPDTTRGYLPAPPLTVDDGEWPLRLQHVRILDLGGPTGPGFARVKVDMSGLEMIRGAKFLFNALYPLTGAPFDRSVETMVDTVKLCGPPPSTIFAGSANKHVFNVVFDPTAEYVSHAYLSFPFGTAPHLVFIFTPDCSSAGRVVRVHNVLCSVVGRILWPLWCRADPKSVTFVGLAELDRRSLGLPLSSSSLEVEEAVRAALGTVAFQEPITHEADLSNFLATVKFLSRAGYRAAVGERAYALETGVDSNAKAPLDHLCYPHILDRVITLAPWESTLRLRGVSRHLKGRADAALFRHIVILPGSLPYLFFLRGAGGRLPALSSWDALHDRLVDDAIRPLFAHTRVLDIPFELDQSIAALVSKLLPNLEVVRNVTKKQTQLMSSVTEVRYRPLAFFQQQNVVRFVPNARGSNARLVVNHLYDSACPAASELPLLSSARGQPGEVVFVFSPFQFPTSGEARPADQFLDDVLAYIVSVVCRRRMGREAARLTLVGVSEMVAAVSVSGGSAASEENTESANPTGTEAGVEAYQTPADPASTRSVLLDPDAFADGRLASTLLQRAFDERGPEWRVPSVGDPAENLRFISRAAYVTNDTTFWETQVPPLAALYAVGWK